MALSCKLLTTARYIITASLALFSLFFFFKEHLLFKEEYNPVSSEKFISQNSNGGYHGATHYFQNVAHVMLTSQE